MTSPRRKAASASAALIVLPLCRPAGAFSVPPASAHSSALRAIDPAALGIDDPAGQGAVALALAGAALAGVLLAERGSGTGADELSAEAGGGGGMGGAGGGGFASEADRLREEFRMREEALRIAMEDQDQEQEVKAEGAEVDRAQVQERGAGREERAMREERAITASAVREMDALHPSEEELQVRKMLAEEREREESGYYDAVADAEAEADADATAAEDGAADPPPLPRPVELEGEGEEGFFGDPSSQTARERVRSDLKEEQRDAEAWMLPKEGGGVEEEEDEDGDAVTAREQMVRLRLAEGTAMLEAAAAAVAEDAGRMLDAHNPAGRTETEAREILAGHFGGGGGSSGSGSGGPAGTAGRADAVALSDAAMMSQVRKIAAERGLMSVPSGTRKAAPRGDGVGEEELDLGAVEEEGGRMDPFGEEEGDGAGDMKEEEVAEGALAEVAGKGRGALPTLPVRKRTVVAVALLFALGRRVVGSVLL
jgi:hypothetical protein